jgi:signal transduction histidine kinase
MSKHTPVDILLVDDNPGKILALQTALAPLGENLVTAHSGRDALRQLLGRNFATVILDVNMPGMDGFETAQLIRGRPASAGTPIIFVSAINLGETDALRGYSLGAVDYITAPVVPEILRAKVQVFVNLHRKTEEAQRHLREVQERTTELQASQQRLRLAERMAALGTLSAGVGHDMGNLLLPIQAQIESLLSCGLPAEAAQSVKSIGACVDHLRRLASGLRLLALDPDHKIASGESTAMAEWWPEMQPVLRNVLPSGATLECQLDPDLPRVRIASHMLSQIVFNLVQNAGDAMRGAQRACAVRVWAAAESGGGAVRVGVSDDGPGMSEEVRQRCLEPFFTTKARGLSTGLGLSLVHGIIQRAGGELRVESRPGAGATFTFSLSSVGPGHAPGARGVRACATIADPRLRGLASLFLRSHAATEVPSPAQVGERGLWIADEASAPREDLERFLAADERRHVLVIGEAGVESPRLLRVPPTVPPSQLRDQISAIVQRVSAGPQAVAQTAAV